MPGEHSKPRFKPEEKDTAPADAASPGVCGYSVRGRIWIGRGDETFLGYGRVVLLERIREHGSISKAAKSMEMSYRHAWELVEEMNCLAPVPLVDTATGGQGGGGAVLTPAGEEAIALFWELYQDFRRYIEKRQEVLGAFLKRHRPDGGPGNRQDASQIRKNPGDDACDDAQGN